MKKIDIISMALLLALSMVACETTSIPQTESTGNTMINATQTPTELPTEASSQGATKESEPVSAKTIPFAEGDIAYHKYAWKTAFEEVKSKEITPGMVAGQHYGYYDSGLDIFAKELVVDDEIMGAYFVTRLDFDKQDQLVSVMPVLEEELSNRARAELYLALVAQCADFYGVPEKTSGPAIGENPNVDQFLSIITSGVACDYIWSDAESNQVILDCHMGQSRLEVVIILNTKEYRM